MGREPGLTITSIQVKHLDPSEPLLKAYVSIVLSGVFAIHNLKVLASDRGLFVSMPARRNRAGGFSDIVHPINHAVREELERAILAAYRGEDWRPPEGTGVVAWVWPPPDDLLGRAMLKLPFGSPSGPYGAV